VRKNNTFLCGLDEARLCEYDLVQSFVDRLSESSIMDSFNKFIKITLRYKGRELKCEMCRENWFHHRAELIDDELK
jgi:hypothetical protein